MGADYPLGIWANAYDPVIWPEGEPAEHKVFAEKLKAFTKEQYASGWAIMGYSAILALTEGINKAQSIGSEKVRRRCSGSPSTHRSASDDSMPTPMRRMQASFGAKWSRTRISIRYHAGCQLSHLRGR